ncbi:ABC transporter permease [Micromonosporaceae bacterium Da 78-11]
MRVFAKLTLIELKMALREPMFAFFVLLFPSILVGILGAVPSFREPSPDLGGGRVIDLYVGISIALVVAILGLQTMPAILSAYREKGILRRLAVTPARPMLLLGAQLAMSAGSAIVSAALVLTIGRLVYDVPLPAQFAGFVLAFLVTVAGVMAIGLLIAALAPTGKTGNAIGTLLFFPSMFFAGLWAPREVMPRTVQRIGDFTPLGAGERALHDAMTGQWPNLLSITVLVAYLVVFGAAAAKLFRWE